MRSVRSTWRSVRPPHPRPIGHGDVLRLIRGGDQRPRRWHGFIFRAAGASQGGPAGPGVHRLRGIALPICQKRFVLGSSTLPGVSPIIGDDPRKAIGFVRGFIALAMQELFPIRHRPWWGQPPPNGPGRRRLPRERGPT